MPLSSSLKSQATCFNRKPQVPGVAGGTILMLSMFLVKWKLDLKVWGYISGKGTLKIFILSDLFSARSWSPHRIAPLLFFSQFMLELR